jgi:hypothetical protein
MKKVLIFLLIVALFSVCGCVTVMSPAVNNADIEKVDFSKSMKIGQSCQNWYLFFGPFGDASIVEAAKNAGIKKVDVVDYKVAWYVLFSQRCAVVYGQ